MYPIHPQYRLVNLSGTHWRKHSWFETGTKMFLSSPWNAFETESPLSTQDLYVPVGSRQMRSVCNHLDRVQEDSVMKRITAYYTCIGNRRLKNSQAPQNS